MATLPDPTEVHREQIIGEAPQEDSSLDWEDVGRLTAAGLTFNWSDEIIAGVKSLFDSEKSYDELVKIERDILREARESSPAGSVGIEMLGAVIPSVASIIYSGGTTTPAVGTYFAANMAKLGFSMPKWQQILKTIGIGTTEGAVAGMGASEGDLVERVSDPDVLISSAAGAGGRLAVTSAGKGLKKVVGSVADRNITRKILQNLNKAEAAELNRIISETGLSAEEIVARVGQGEVIADMSEAAADALRALYGRAGAGRDEISDVLKRRASELPASARQAIQRDLTPDLQGTEFETGNIVKYFGKATKQRKADEGRAYDRIFDEWSGTSEELNEAVLGIYLRQPRLRGKIKSLMEASGKPTPVKWNKKTKAIELTGDVDLETAEIVRRALSDSSSKAFRDGEGSLGKAIGDLEGNLRRVLDDASPELKKTRAAWAAIESASKAFEDGRKILTKSADDVDVIFEELVAKGNQNNIAAFRAGYATALRNKQASGNITTLFRNLSDVDKKDAQILRIIYPGDNLDRAVKKIELASAAMQTRNKILGGSPTATTQEAGKKIGTASALFNVADIALSPARAPFAAMRLIRDFIGAKSKNLSSEQMTTVAKMLVEEDPDTLRRILGNEDLLFRLSEKYNRIVDGMISGVARGAVITTGADVQSESVKTPRVIQSIMDVMSDDAKNKVTDAASQ